MNGLVLVLILQFQFQKHLNLFYFYLNLAMIKYIFFNLILNIINIHITFEKNHLLPIKVLTLVLYLFSHLPNHMLFLLKIFSL